MSIWAIIGLNPARGRPGSLMRVCEVVSDQPDLEGQITFYEACRGGEEMACDGTFLLNTPWGA
jgi:hypothetical protein